jgi:hypothetical protein
MQIQAQPLDIRMRNKFSSTEISGHSIPAQILVKELISFPGLQFCWTLDKKVVKIDVEARTGAILTQVIAEGAHNDLLRIRGVVRTQRQDLPSVAFLYDNIDQTVQSSLPVGKSPMHECIEEITFAIIVAFVVCQGLEMIRLLKCRRMPVFFSVYGIVD